MCERKGERGRTALESAPARGGSACAGLPRARNAHQRPFSNLLSLSIPRGPPPPPSRRRRRPPPLGPAATPAAAAAAASLRRANPGDHPPAGHCLRRLDASGLLSAPALCGVCFTPVDGPPGGGAAAPPPHCRPPTTRRWRRPRGAACCDVCGVAVHEGGCARRLPADCRPVATGGGGGAGGGAAAGGPAPAPRPGSADGGGVAGAAAAAAPPASPGTAPAARAAGPPPAAAHHWRAAATVVALADADAALERGPSTPDAVWESVIGPGVAGPAGGLGSTHGRAGGGEGGPPALLPGHPGAPPPLPACLYCRTPTDAGTEPVWACTWCGEACHPACHAAAAAALEEAEGGGRAASASLPSTPAPPPCPPAGLSALVALRRRGASPAPAAARPLSPALRAASPAPTATVGLGSGGGGGKDEAAAQPPPPPPPLPPPAWLAASTHATLSRAAACALGRPAYASLVLPPSAVSPAPGHPSWAARARVWVAAAARRASAGGDGGASAAEAGGSPARRPRPAPVHADEGHASPGLLAGDSDEGGGGPGAVSQRLVSPSPGPPPLALVGGAAPRPAAPLPPRAAPAPARPKPPPAPPRSPWSSVTIDPASLPPTCTPLLVVLNTASGPQLGRALRRAFLRRLNPLQVCEVPRHAPDAALASLGRLPRARILAVGGDGTVGWVLGVLDRLGAEAGAEAAAAVAAGRPPPPPWVAPPVAILPLGTGNDLARTLGWGGGLGCVRAAGLDALLADVAGAALTLVDRWGVGVREGGAAAAAAAAAARKGDHLPPPPCTGAGAGAGAGAAAASAPPTPLPAPPPPPAPPLTAKPMTNYVGFGVDAKVALDFHAARAAYPAWFTSQVGNKLWYTGLGGVEALARAGGRGLPDRLALTCDGAPVPLPPGTEGVLLLNIPSYMGGVDLWGSGVEEVAGGAGSGGGGGGPPGGGAPAPPSSALLHDPAQPPQPPHPRHAPPSFGDGRLEVVAVYGSWHLGQLQVGLARAVRLTQCSSARVVVAPGGRGTGLPPDLAVQVDGEPWLAAAPAVFEVSQAGSARMLRRLDPAGPLARLAGGVADALAAAAARGVITPAQREALATEIAARMHRV